MIGRDVVCKRPIDDEDVNIQLYSLDEQNCVTKLLVIQHFHT